MSETEGNGEGPVSEADVYKAGVLAARLTKTPGEVTFSSLDDYLSSSGDSHPVVATTLPLGNQITAVLDATTHLETELRDGALPLNPRQIADTVAGLRHRRRLLSS